jgi:hypothetical protein
VTDCIVVAGRLPTDEPLTSTSYEVHDFECRGKYDYWAGLASVWARGRTVVNVEHDMPFSDDMVEELLSCDSELCAYPYVVRPGRARCYTFSASNGRGWLKGDEPFATFSAIGFAKIAASAQEGTNLERCRWGMVEGKVHLAVASHKRVWHIHWPEIPHGHDYEGEMQKMATVTNPTPHKVFVNVLGCDLYPNQSLKVSRAQGVRLAASPVLIVAFDDEPIPQPKKPAVRRTTAVRGSQRIEVNEAAAAEARG